MHEPVFHWKKLSSACNVSSKTAISPVDFLSLTSRRILVSSLFNCRRFWILQCLMPLLHESEIYNCVSSAYGWKDIVLLFVGREPVHDTAAARCDRYQSCFSAVVCPEAGLEWQVATQLFADLFKYFTKKRDIGDRSVAALQECV